MMLSPTDAAYLAGFIDGEGCIAYREKVDGAHIVLEVVQTVRAPLDWAVEVTGCGRVTVRREARANRRDVYHWKVYGMDEICQILEAVRPYMKVKYAEATAMIVAGHLRKCRPSPGKKNPLYDQEHAAGAIVRGLKRPDSLEEMLAATMDLAADLRTKVRS